jgi:HK97 family phage major capsid protein
MANAHLLLLLREQKNSIAKQAQNMLANNGSKIWSAEEQASYDKFMDEMTRVNAQILAHEKAALEAADNDLEQITNEFAGKKSSDPLRDIFNTYLRKKPDSYSNEEMASIRNAMSTTVGAEGGFTVPVTVHEMVVDLLKQYGGMRSVAEVINTSSGELMNWPTSDGTAEEGEIVGENITSSVLDTTFGVIGLPTYHYSSKSIPLPWQLIADSNIDVIALVLSRIASRLGRITNKHFTIGTGTAQPSGILQTAASGTVGATGTTTSIIYDKLVDLEHAVDPAYRASAQYMMHDLSVAVIRKIKDTQGRPIFVPGYDSPTGGAPDMLMGKAIVINQDMPVMAANAKSILFGDFSQYKIRDVIGSAQVRRFDDSPFALKGQVGFCGWQRSGGALVQPQAVKFYQNSAA